MNERIRELAERVKVIMDGDDDLEFYTEKFAELIVKECAKVANDNFDKGFCPVGEFITEHFGVE